MKAKSRARSCLRILLLLATLSGVVAVAPVVWTEDAARVSTSSSSRNLARHVQFLASEKLTGRGVGTSGIALARDYIAAEFARYGLRPGGENGFLQSFEVAVGVEVKAPSRLRIAGEEALALNRQWVPLALSASAKVEAELVFAGYGITAEDHGYDDYEDIDVKGKIVLVLRYEPPPKRADSPFKKSPEHSSHSALRTKANNARDHGAVGMILVDLHNPAGGKANLLPVSMGLWRGGDSLVAVQVEREVIERRLAERGVSLMALKEKIDATEKPASMALPAITAEIQVTLADVRRDAENVIAVFPGSDPALREENIVIGAHYDHVGFGHYGGRDARAAGTVHPGADDNASGAAVLLELARRFAELPSKPSRTIIFVAFSAEELGLLGSRHFAARAKSVAATKAMINLDMVGRLRGDRVTVFGTRSGQNLSPIVAAAAQRLGFELIESDHIGRSDHLSFYSKQIPVLHFFTGLHSDYHRPTDTREKLNIDGMVRITDLVMATVLPIADAEAPMKFVSLPSGRAARPKDAGKNLAYLGSIPVYGANTEGVELAGVSEGSPAALAGLRPGDVILQLGDKKIRNIEDLTAALHAQKPSDEVALVILRAGNLLTVKATLRKRVAAFVHG